MSALLKILGAALAAWVIYGLFNPEKAPYWKDFWGKALKTRKRVVITFATACLMVFAFAFLQSNHSPERNTSSTSSKSSSNQPAPQSERTREGRPFFRLEKQFRVGNLIYRIDSVRIDNAVGRMLKEERTDPRVAFIVVSFTAKNDGLKTADVSPDELLQIEDGRGRIFEPSTDATYALPDYENSLLEQLQPGVPKQMKLAFEVPISVIEEDFIIIATSARVFGTERPDDKAKVLVGIE